MKTHPRFRPFRGWISLFVLSLFFTSCAYHGSDDFVPVPEKFSEPHYPTTDSLISPGDELTIRFYYHPELNDTLTVRPDGKISLMFFQGLDVAGKTPDQLQEELVKLYSKEFLNPVITVNINKQNAAIVYITGEVMNGGAKPLPVNMTVGQMLAQSSVNFKTALLDSVALVRRHSDKEYKAYLIDASMPNGKHRDIYLAAGDILVVPRDRISKAGDFVQKYIRDLIPATTTVGLSYYYDLNNDGGIK